jgi:hypothetical protein
VDRVDTDRICKPYQYLRNTIYEKRIKLYSSTLLKEELVGLERDNNSGKVDHSTNGINSKDSADGICGALWNASLHAEELSIDYMEEAESMLGANTESDTTSQEQILLDFENEMKIALTNILPQNQPTVNYPVQQKQDYNNSQLFVYDGIMMW